MARQRSSVLALALALATAIAPAAGAAIGDISLLSRADGVGGVEGDQNSSMDETMGGLSSNGRYAVFSSTATNLVGGDSNLRRDIFLRDRLTNTTTRVSVATGGTQADDDSFETTISPNGRYVVFTSKATN